MTPTFYDYESQVGVFGRFWESAGLVWTSRWVFGLPRFKGQGFMVIPQAEYMVVSVAFQANVIRGDSAA